MPMCAGRPRIICRLNGISARARLQADLWSIGNQRQNTRDGYEKIKIKIPIMFAQKSPRYGL